MRSGPRRPRYPHSFDRRGLNGVAGPVFVAVAYADHENGSALFDPVDDEMSFERMNPHQRRNFFPLTRHSYRAQRSRFWQS